MRLTPTFFLFLFPFLSQSQSLFFNTYGTTLAEERAFDMVILDDGSIITAGDRYETASFERTGYLLKVNADGNEEWNRQLTSNEELYGTTICQLPNGNVFISGYDYDVPNRNFGIVVAEYNETNGLPVYQKTHEFAQDTKPADCIPTSDNGAIVLSTFETSSTKTILLVKFDSNGDTVWTKLVDPFSGKETPREMALTDNGMIITGSVSSGSNDNVFAISTDLEGNILWQEEYPSSGISLAESVVQIPAGGFYLAGTTNAIGSGGLDLLVMKLDPAGQLLWAKDYGRNGSELGFDIDVMPDGGAALTGSAFRDDTSAFRDLALIRIDEDGEAIWTRYFGQARAETGHEVKVVDDQIIVCGKADANETEDVAILRSDFNGNIGVGISERETSISWNIYPNPFIDQVTIQLKEQTTESILLRITDFAGKLVLETTFQSTVTLDLQSLPVGVYFVTHIGSLSSSTSFKLVKGH